jgi:hypothetical protein
MVIWWMALITGAVRMCDIGRSGAKVPSASAGFGSPHVAGFGHSRFAGFGEQSPSI